ncbi:alpha/beta fold hydrolase [Microbacterium murale]|uniref:Pimeloyl-ACP methyl ester carboxylesterase n=1 Tax=Microbacterium murale TaxID=1081040 RepID=A0ABU0P722_9MICO|nr:alpha/beta hydrolase [Microbacterium murale]MDQ0643135.1 pimeloyl-ACP methyl ester carboxylesterase [Microbacterium murale]
MSQREHATIRRRQFRLSGGETLSYLAGGDPSRPAVLLLHGFPNSSEMFREIAQELSESAFIIAPDLPGFGESDVLTITTFDRFGEAVAELLSHLEVGARYIYLHDFGAPVGLHLAMADPEQVLGLIIQNANAHWAGIGPDWAGTIPYWTERSAENEAAATSHLTLEGIRDQYLAEVPPDVTAGISDERWKEDWRVMNLPGRREVQRALIADYGTYVSRFPSVAEYLARWQPSALLLWGRHDAFFELDETLSWMRALPRMEAHIFDGGHLLLETHSPRVAPVLRDFVEQPA